MIRERVGVVLSDKMDKTRVILVDRLMQHNKYGKVLKDRKKFYAHDSNNQSKKCDRVRIQESKPISHLKRWRVVEVYKEA